MALNINGTTGISGVDGSASAPAVTGTDSNTGINFASDTVNINTGGTTRATVDSNGRLGIGTTSPSQQLTMVSSSDSKINIRGHGSSTGYFLGMSSAVNAQVWNAESGYIQFATNDTERMRVDSSGHFLFQATSSGQVGIMMFTSATSPYSRIMHGGSGSSFTGHTLIEFRSTVDGVIGEIKQDGDGTITYATSSDYRLKENIVDLTGAITRLKNLKPKRFNFKKNSSITKDGFLAHELQEVIPEAVNGTKDEVVTEDSKANIPQLADEEVGNPVYQTADLTRIVPLLTAALQEAVAKIEVLETKVAALEAG